MLGTFSGYCELVIKQDICVNILFYNLQTVAQLGAEKKLKSINTKRKSKDTKNKKKENEGYQLNRNIGANTLRMYLEKLLTSCAKKLKNILEEMDTYFLQSLEMINPHKQERKRKIIRQNDRHHTELNYKRGF